MRVVKLSSVSLKFDKIPTSKKFISKDKIENLFENFIIGIISIT